jgi:hypothetical protein
MASLVACSPSTASTPDAMGAAGTGGGPVGSGGTGGTSACSSGDTSAACELADASRWATFDLGANKFVGGAFDGHYLYFAPAGGRVVGRYDTTSSFSVAASWTTFDLTPLAATAAFEGAAFDGRYLYLVGALGTTALARYDTRLPFSSSSSWTLFDPSTVDPTAYGFVGATFDGRYLYLVPSGALPPHKSIVARFDTTADLSAASSWSTLDVATVAPSAGGFCGGLFDGRYIYFAPCVPHASVVARYDTTADFATGSSWSAFDASSVEPTAQVFFTTAFDGRYVYFAPTYTGLAEAPVRFDTQGSFMDASAWSSFNLSAYAGGNRGYQGSAYDGRYVYYAPSNGNFPGTVARYDTRTAFGDGSSWSLFDLTKINANASTFSSAMFDGRYVYFIPLGETPVTTSIVARYDANPMGTSLPALCSDAAALHCDPGSWF